MASDGTSAPVKRPELECDIVMAGGVTSGIIYPGAVEQISRHYVFRSIGGTSVGAMGAAVTAAAEYGRLTGKNPKAFKDIATIPASLGGRAAEGHSRLFHLFTPEEGTRKLYAFIMPIFSGSSWPVRLVKMMPASFRTIPIALATIVGLVLGAAGLVHAIVKPDELLLLWPVLALAVFTAIVLAGALVTSGALQKAVEALACIGLVIFALAFGVVHGWNGVVALFLALAGVAATLGVGFLAWLSATGFVLKTFWLPALVDNKYGICTGLSKPDVEPKVGEAPFLGLTNWLHAEVQSAAGRSIEDPPLTFGDLWGAPMDGRSEPIAGTKVDPRAKRSIDLAMIASDISRQRTAQLPFLEMLSPIYVERAVLDAYFPPSVVRWLAEDRCPSSDPPVEEMSDVTYDTPFVRLRSPQNLPIIFGARLSLSFPILLSAIPLLTPDFTPRATAGAPRKLRRVWFSDGGLTSNFPIHFFDSPLPTRPTFCLNLVDHATGLDEVTGAPAKAPKKETGAAAPDEETDDDDAAAVGHDGSLAAFRGRAAANRPKTGTPLGDPVPNGTRWDLVSMIAGNRTLPARFNNFADGGLKDFLETLLNTARFWSDNEMLISPGARDRVVNIGLFSDEGGLNLDMEKSVIDELDWRGKAAGQLIAARFNPGATIDPKTGGPNVRAFTNHRWVRYRNFMAAYEDMMRRFPAARAASDKAARERQEWQLDEMIDGKAGKTIGYRIPKSARAYYRKTTEALERASYAMAADSAASEFATFDRTRNGSDTPLGAAPRPKMRFRLRPIVNDDPRLAHADLPTATAPPSTPGGTGDAGPAGEAPPTG